MYSMFIIDYIFFHFLYVYPRLTTINFTSLIFYLFTLHSIKVIILVDNFCKLITIYFNNSNFCKVKDTISKILAATMAIRV